LYHGKPSPRISAYSGFDAVKPKNNFASTGTKAATIGYAFAGINLMTREETGNDNATTVTQAAAAATTGSTLGNTHTTTGTLASFPAEVSAAIQQLAANQTAIMQQFAAFTVNNQPPPTRRNVQVPPVTNINIPQQQYEGFQQQTGSLSRGRA
jgi:hypothetical protein